jgi:serine/threonine protein kinase
MPEWIGKTIGKVRIEKLLARGGTAEVYLGTHVTLARPVAVKLLHSYIEEEPLLIERFQREARVVAGLRHPNIVQVLDFDTIDGHPYIVMEYLQGPTLATYLRHLHQRKKRSPHVQVAHLLNGLTAALDYAHTRGVIHRDIKPANILLHNKMAEFPLDKPLPADVEAVVADFGLVRLVDAATHTTSGIISGTPAYMSPEQALGHATDRRTDIYSLGIVLYEMLAGSVPFQADNTLTVLHMLIHAPPLPIQGISAKVQDVVNRALQKNPDDRYQTSRELANDFSRAIGLKAEVGGIPAPTSVTPQPIELPVETPISKVAFLPPDLLELLSHNNSSVRKLAVQELLGLLDSKHLGLSQAAQEKLREIATTDDSLTVRRMAAQELSVRGFEADTSVPLEVYKEKRIEEKPIEPKAIEAIPMEAKPVEVKRSPENKFSLLEERLRAWNPLPSLRQRKFALPKLERRFVGGILGITLGLVFLAGARQLIVNRLPIVAGTDTATITLTQPSTPSESITPQSTETSVPTSTQTLTATATATSTPTATLTPTRTFLPSFTVRPTRKPPEPDNPDA